MPAGRPSEYSESILIQSAEYLKACSDKRIKRIAGESEKFTKYDYKLKVNLPTLEGLARYLKIHRDTVYAWEKEHPEFSDIIGELRAKQLESLVNNGLSGDYNPTIAKVLLAKHGYKESTEVENKGGVKFTFEEPDEYKKLYPSEDQGNIGESDSVQ